MNDSAKGQLHALLDAVLRLAVIDGKSSERIFEVPYVELASEMKHYETPIETDMLNVRVKISVNISTEEDVYDTGPGFTIADKTRH